MNIELIQGDCLTILPDIDEPVDLVLSKPSCGSSISKWDAGAFWQGINGVVEGNSAVVLFGTEPFSSVLRMSNIKNYKYDWTWEKDLPTNSLHANRQPLRKLENICVFHNGASYYYPQKTTGRGPAKVSHHGLSYKGGTERFPVNLLTMNAVSVRARLHPTEKPVQLLEYLIKTYTKQGDTVLDFAMGSGSTGVACKQLNRNFIGIEREQKYFEIAKQRIEEAVTGSSLPLKPEPAHRQRVKL